MKLSYLADVVVHFHGGEVIRLREGAPTLPDTIIHVAHKLTRILRQRNKKTRDIARKASMKLQSTNTGINFDDDEINDDIYDVEPLNFEDDISST